MQPAPDILVASWSGRYGIIRTPYAQCDFAMSYTHLANLKELEHRCMIKGARIAPY